MGGDLLSELRKRVLDFKKQRTLFEDRDRFYKSRAWARTRVYILKRDGNECQACKARGLVTTNNLIIHHIDPLEYAPMKALDESNLITVCVACHNYIHGTSKKREESTKWNDEYW